MAGFLLKSIDNKKSYSLMDNIQRNIRYFSVFGTNFDESAIKQSKSIGVNEVEDDNLYSPMYGLQNAQGHELNKNEFIAFFDRQYATRREFLRRFSLNVEIEQIVEIISDETVIYDENNFFAYPNTQNLKSLLKAEKAKEIVDDLNESFKSVYYKFGFNNGHDAWHYVKKLLIDGFLSFEIIYDGEGSDDAKSIIGFKEIDATTLEPEIRVDEQEREYRVWIQFRGDAKKERVMLDGNLIYISWARGNFISRLSYVERLVRSFNMLRTMENSRIIWNVINAQQRVQIEVPIGTQSEAKSRTRLSQLRAMYKEDVTIDENSAELSFNGQPNFSFFKTYITPTKGGETTKISTIENKGYDLSDTKSLQYFYNRFMLETKVPSNRFSGGAEGKTDSAWGAGGESILREEMRFSYFINRIRSIFQEILLKPTWIQFCLKHPNFVGDQTLKGSIGLEFIEENLFTTAKKREIAKKGADTVTALMGVKEDYVDATGAITPVSYFDPKFLVEKYMDFTEDDVKLNVKYKTERRKEIARLQAVARRLEAQNGGAGGAGAGGGDFGGGSDFGGGGPENFGGEEPPPETEEPPTEETTPEEPIV